MVLKRQNRRASECRQAIKPCALFLLAFRVQKTFSFFCAHPTFQHKYSSPWLRCPRPRHMRSRQHFTTPFATNFAIILTVKRGPIPPGTVAHNKANLSFQPFETERTREPGIRDQARAPLFLVGEHKNKPTGPFAGPPGLRWFSPISAERKCFPSPPQTRVVLRK